MIALFPSIYEDELAYSLFARYYMKSGFTTFLDVAEALYMNKWCRPDAEFINKLSPEVQRLITRDMAMETFVEYHTMLPYYGRFISMERRKKALESLVSMDGNYRNILPVANSRSGEKRFLRYCPECVKEDREIYGETYWHRIHQMPDVNVCSKHGCYLQESRVPLNAKSSPNLIPAEQEIEDTEVLYCNNGRELELANYITSVFLAPMDYKKTDNIGIFLHEKLPRKYLSDSGLVRSITEFYEDYKNFYKKTPSIMKEANMQKIFNGYRWSCYDICQMALFEGIEVQELLSFHASTENIMKNTYEKLAKQYELEYSVVEAIGDKIIKDYYHKSRVQKKCGARKYKWNQIDEKLLPEVKRLLEEMYHKQEGRPVKINIHYVVRKMNLPDKYFDNLPLCKTEILKYEETQEHFWAREILWAIRKIEDEGNTACWSRVAKLINIRKRNFEASIPDLLKMSDDDATGKINRMRERIRL